MTTQSDLKKRVRARQAKTGEPYTTARAHVIGALRAGPQGEAELESITAVVLKCNEKSVRLRVCGQDKMLTLRCGSTDAWRLKPAQLIEVTLNKRWTWRDDTYAAGVISRRWFDAAALALTPLPLRSQGVWDLNETFEPMPPSSPSHSLWAKAAAEPREAFEFDGIAWGAGIDPDDPDACPVSDAAEMADAGQARQLLMDTLLADLRCIDAHVHLGHQRFDKWPEDAIGHYEIARAIGELSLGSDFPGILPWGCLYNRPYLRALHAHGLCLWRAGQADQAQAAFERVLALNPTDNQGARFCWDEVRQGRPWRPDA
jgi:hypothetical protein